MAGTLNKATIIGHLGQDPDVRYTPSGVAVATISVATTEVWRDKNTSEKQERTEWHRCVLWNKLAEIASQYLRKGSLVYIEGEIQTRKWQDKDGNDRYTTEIKAREMKMLGKPAGQSSGHQQSAPPAAPPPSGGADFEDDDIPF